MKCEHCGQELPQPPTLREQVERVLNNAGAYSTDRDHTAAVLAVVADAAIEQLIALVGPRFADWLAAQPMPYPNVVTRGQRDHDVRLLRGGSDV